MFFSAKHFNEIKCFFVCVCVCVCVIKKHTGCGRYCTDVGACFKIAHHIMLPLFLFVNVYNEQKAACRCITHQCVCVNSSFTLCGGGKKFTQP